ncbi:MarR family transcriptional regulator [Streptomyces sp. SID7909]|uniref:MarR family winged helix-turn-helix transcriptional regulator n=1 Tax=Streptomyces sp. SID7909 TaxID=2706092 RepID=UPI0013B6411A|nr:MarR family transcriptional regulator [Streptomyces sp. SID7909]NEC09614.1 MarR family transcriptional regulator [Streptomyces sp. SID7909]
MSRAAATARMPDDVDEVSRAVLTASRMLAAISARSLSDVEQRVTLPQFRMLVLLSTQGPSKLVALADLLGTAPSSTMRMVDRLISIGLALRETNPDNRRETLLRLTDDGRRTVQDVTRRRHHEITAIVQKMASEQRATLVQALNTFSQAGGEPLIAQLDETLNP